MNPLPMLIALWRAIVRVVVDVFTSEPPVPPAKRDPIASRERRRRNARRRQVRALRTRRCRHGRQMRTSPRSRRRGAICPLPPAPVIAAIDPDELPEAARRAICSDLAPSPSSQGPVLGAYLEAPPAPALQASIEIVEVRRNKSEEGWEAVPRGHRRAPLCESREAAVAAARKRLSEGSGGEILVLNDTGKVTQTIPVLGAAARELCPHLDLDGAKALAAA